MNRQLVIVTAFLLGVVGCQRGAPTNAGTMSRGDEVLQNAKVDQSTHNAKDDNINCVARAAEITYAYDSPPDGQLVSFECRDSSKPVQIELATKALEGGKIITKDFGTIQMKMAGSGVRGISYFTGKQMMKAVQKEGYEVSGADYYMSPSQIRGVKNLLAQQSDSKVNRVPVTATQGSAEDYRNVTPADGLPCGALIASMKFSFGGAPPSGTLNGYECQDKQGKTRRITLKSTALVAGKIETQDFGTIHITQTNGTSATYAMTESQIKKLKAFLGF